MLPPFIIEQIREREERERRQQAPQPFLELPIYQPMPRDPVAPEESDRGVVIIDLCGD